MIKNLAFVLVMFCVGFVAKAQGITLGVAGGGNMSTLNLENAQYRLGYQAGGFAKLMVTRRMGLQTEILYSVQQADLMDQRITLDYVLIPVLLKINLNKFINLQLGPQYSMFVSSSGSFDALEGNSVKNKNISFALGVGLELPMGFSANLRFANAIDNSFSQIGEVTSDVVQLSVAFDLLSLKNY